MKLAQGRMTPGWRRRLGKRFGALALAAAPMVALAGGPVPLASVGISTATSAATSATTMTSPATPAALSTAASPPGAPRVPDTLAQRLIACTACHGKEGRAASDGYYPRIAGKPAGYLMNQLRNFRDGRRQYPLMIYMVQHQSDAYLQEIADYFAALHPPYPLPRPAMVSQAVLDRGAQLVHKGDSGGQVPACAACHGAALTGVVPAVPGLLGLPRDYISAQLGAWRNGSRHAAAPDCMATIAGRLSLADVGAVAAWLAAQPVPRDSAPAAPPLPAAPRLPLDCGSIVRTTAAR